MKNRIKYWLMMIVLIGSIDLVSAQQKIIRYEGGRRSSHIEMTRKLDSLLKTDTVIHRNVKGKADTLIIRTLLSTKDSVIVRDSLEMAKLIAQRDSLSAKDSLMAARKVERDTTIQVEYLKLDTIFLGVNALFPKKGDDKQLQEPLKLKKFSLIHDTISAGKLTLLSLIPGVGQVYNRQYWKVPVFYGAMGGFMAAGIISSSKYKTLKLDWEQSVALNLPQTYQDQLFTKMNDQGTVRTIFFTAAAATYLYQVADATFNYRGKTNHIRKATTLAMVFPGAGFMYTKTYWRLPIYYGGFAVLASVVDYNQRYYQRYSKAYNALTDNDPTTISEFGDAKQATYLKGARDSFRRNRDLGIISLFGAYILSIVDTHVIATLKNWDISPDLSVTIEPVIFNSTMNSASVSQSGGGMSLKIRF